MVQRTINEMHFLKGQWMRFVPLKNPWWVLLTHSEMVQPGRTHKMYFPKETLMGLCYLKEILTGCAYWRNQWDVFRERTSIEICFLKEPLRGNWYLKKPLISNWSLKKDMEFAHWKKFNVNLFPERNNGRFFPDITNGNLISERTYGGNISVRTFNGISSLTEPLMELAPWINP